MNLLYVIAMYGMEHLAGVVHRELAYAFQARGHSVTVFALTSAPEQSGRQADSIEDRIPVHRAVAAGKLPDDWLNRVTLPLFKYNRFVSGLAHYVRYLARHPEFDLALIEGAYPFGAMAALANLANPTPFVVSVKGGDFIASHRAEYGYGRYRLARRLMQLAFQRAALIRVTTPLVREHVLAYGAAPTKIGIVPSNLANYSFPDPGVDLTEFRKHARAEIGARYPAQLQGCSPLLVCAGRLLPIKGYDVALRAFAALRDAFPNARLIFIGPDRATRAGSYQKQLEAIASSLGVRDSVLFAGTVEHPAMRTWFAAADILLAPSILEGMNRTVLEAAAVGTPAIISRTAGIADAAVAMNAGVAVETGDPDALAQAIRALLNDPPRYAALSRAGPAFAMQFSSARVGAQLVELCERALPPKQRANH